MLQEVESVLGESEQERKDIRDKYIALGEKVEMLLHQEERVKSNADRDTEAAKMAVKEAVSDLEMVIYLYLFDGDKVCTDGHYTVVLLTSECKTTSVCFSQPNSILLHLSSVRQPLRTESSEQSL